MEFFQNSSRAFGQIFLDSRQACSEYFKIWVESGLGSKNEIGRPEDFEEQTGLFGILLGGDRMFGISLQWAGLSVVSSRWGGIGENFLASERHWLDFRS